MACIVTTLRAAAIALAGLSVFGAVALDLAGPGGAAFAYAPLRVPVDVAPDRNPVRPVSQAVPRQSPFVSAKAKANAELHVLEERCKSIAQPYREAISAHNQAVNAYWSKVSSKRSARSRKRKQGQALVRNDYVTTFPPSYDGPKQPKCLSEIARLKRGPTKRAPSTIGRVSDFKAAAKSLYGFTPRAPRNEQEFKRVYAREALALGLTQNQVVGVYALETGGIGPYNRQSGIFPIDYKCRKLPKPKGRPASTAIGYSQLLSANSSAVIAENGEAFARRLEFEAVQAQGDRKAELMEKARVIRQMRRDIKRGIARYRNRNNWREFVAFGKTKRGYAVHALNLDVDVGPMMQVNKLRKIVDVSEKRGFKNISGPELELMNLAGYGRGLEMMTPVAGDIPTSNFFSRAGYYRNPVVKDRSADELLAKLGEIIEKRKKNCGAREFIRVFQELEAN